MEEKKKIITMLILLVICVLVSGILKYYFFKKTYDEMGENKNVQLANTQKENIIEDVKISEDEGIKKVKGRVGKYIKKVGENDYVEDEEGTHIGWIDAFIEGCGWWCTVDSMDQDIVASSTLEDNSGITYYASNVGVNVRTSSWVEGVEGDGIGEWIEISRKYLCREGDTDGGKFGEICIANGYTSNNKLWKENNRVKTLLMYVNNKPYVYIELEDTIQPQYFNVWGENEYYQLEPSQEIKLKFEIVEVYEGTKYDDTAITYLDIDFLKGH